MARLRSEPWAWVQSAVVAWPSPPSYLEWKKEVASNRRVVSKMGRHYFRLQTVDFELQMDYNLMPLVAVDAAQSLSPSVAVSIGSM